MRSGIYFIVNLITLKLYIGSAVYFARRRSEHFTRLAKGIHHNQHMQRAYNKYGKDAFEFIIVELAPLDKLIELETYYIAKHRTTEEEFGYNKCPFGVSAIGRKHSQETIEKIRNSNKGKVVSQQLRNKISATLINKNLKMTDSHKEKLRQSNLNRKYKPVSETTKELMSKNRKGKKWTDNRRKANKSSNFVFLNQPPINC